MPTETDMNFAATAPSGSPQLQSFLNDFITQNNMLTREQRQKSLEADTMLGRGASPGTKTRLNTIATQGNQRVTDLYSSIARMRMAHDSMIKDQIDKENRQKAYIAEQQAEADRRTQDQANKGKELGGVTSLMSILAAIPGFMVGGPVGASAAASGAGSLASSIYGNRWGNAPDLSGLQSAFGTMAGAEDKGQLEEFLRNLYPDKFPAAKKPWYEGLFGSGATGEPPIPSGGF